jgi:hypothetical protein
MGYLLIAAAFAGGLAAFIQNEGAPMVAAIVGGIVLGAAWVVLIVLYCLAATLLLLPDSDVLI